ncbi:Protein NRT1/ PTR FAMILY 5.10 [Rhynchospora pubera]|uniref:Protein NRT1/ PTR FAMILY 5.10 n=1 Tax=Rhynchospora pubera TaxID=906938 RepID=A0AAV8G6Z0_9POAL|nr:Protein NRT1/ PTR FAMILY 5.10 [Rhynchospora pubera]
MSTHSMESQHQPLLDRSGPLNGFVDYRGRPVHRSSSGGWNAGLFLLGLEVAARFAYYGVSSNLITYLTGPLGMSIATAAAAANAWSGSGSMLPLVGASLADSWLGRYRAIALATVLSILGYGMLALSAVLPPLKPSECHSHSTNNSHCGPTSFQLAFFFISLYLIAIAQGFDKPCGLAFGADQFDQSDPQEYVSRSSFFNWWYFSMCTGITIAVVVASYIEDNIGWGLGFGMLSIIMIPAFIMFLLGTSTYRFHEMEKKTPFGRLGRSFVSLARTSLRVGTMRFKEEEENAENQHAKTQTVSKIEEARSILRLFPIWATSLVYGITFAQITTFFTKQSQNLDRRFTSSIIVPPAALQSSGTIAIIVFVPIYDRLIVPVMRIISKSPSGITMLQRVGTGIAVSLVTMVVAALVEMKRLKTAREYGLVDQPEATIPMSLWWVVPQFVLIGIADVFTVVGLQEFFYDQMPDSMRSLGLALFQSILGIGAFLSSILISCIDKITSSNVETWGRSTTGAGGARAPPTAVEFLESLFSLSEFFSVIGELKGGAEEQKKRNRSIK